MTKSIIKLTLDDSRRLTGANLVWDHTGAILDAFVSGIDQQVVIDCWQKQLDKLFIELGWQDPKSVSRQFEDGVSLLISAPLDALYAATEINEAAWFLACAELQNFSPIESWQALILRLNQQIAQERNPALIALVAAAESHQVPYLIDDDEFSLGFGKSCQCWPVTQLPKTDEIDWAKYHAVPVAMVTGTNGKSTSVRLCAEIIKFAGKKCGVSSTDFIMVDNQIIDRGDYSGPMGARLLLRHPETQVAVLEVARGGLLRRGLPIPKVDAALITNIAEDHFGQYGINNLDALTQAKCIVTKAVVDGVLVLNADDQQLVKASKTLDNQICWFSIDKNNSVFDLTSNQQIANCYLDNGQLIYQDKNTTTKIVSVNEVAMTLNGAARHNVQNALGAIGLACGLEIDFEAIKKGLIHFKSDLKDNPGRGNLFEVKGAQVIVDFAHNAHSMTAMAQTAQAMPAKRKLLLLSAPGDRSDLDIINMTKAALTMQPDLIIIAEIKDYLRGRTLNEVPQIIARAAQKEGQNSATIMFSEDSLSGAKKIIQQLAQGDLALIMALTQREEISSYLQQC